MNQYYVNTCRICLRTKDVLISLFRSRKGISPYDKLMKHTKLTIKTNDAGPCSICSECLCELDRTVIFLEKCENSNKILLAAWSQSVNEENLNSKLDSFEPSSITDVNLSQDAQEVQIEKSGDEINRKINVIELLDDRGCPECGSKRRCRHWSPPTTHTCQQCGKTFSKKYNCQLHIKRHLRELDWSCPTCGLPQLTRWHAERHCAPRPRRPCPIPGCGKTFTTNTNLKTHIRMHNGERPYICDDCGKGFRCKNTLSEHIRIHTGEKPYICPVCGLRFRTNKIAVHMCSHADRSAEPRPQPRPPQRLPPRRAHPRHSCTLCSARYVHKQSLNKHMKNHHGHVRDTLLNI